MKFMSAVLFVACAAVPATLSAQDFKWIKTEAEFKSLVVGNKLWIEQNHVTVRANGSLTGKFGGQRLRGVWEWRGDYWCRTLTTHATNTDCQKWETDGTVFRATRAKGKGRSFVYSLKRS